MKRAKVIFYAFWEKLCKQIKLVCWILLLVIVSISNSRAQCSSAGPNSPGSMSNDASTGVRAWSNVSNALSSNNSYASVSALILGQKTNYLCATNFGFNIDPTYNICGIEVHIEKSFTGLLGSISDVQVKVIKGGVITGNNLAAATGWPSSDTYSVYGSTGTNWGTNWSPADINSSGFGVAVSANLGGVLALPTARIDHIEIVVYYDIPLPVQLISFEASCIQDGININWITATENNNARFDVMRSSDGAQWTKLTSVTGNGTTSNVSNYNYVDYTPLPQINYYRLMQWDYNGLYNLLPVIAIKNNCFRSHDEIKLYPNPVNDILTISYYSLESTILDVEIFDHAAQKILEQKINVIEGINKTVIDISKLRKNNFYVVKVFNLEKNITAQFYK